MTYTRKQFISVFLPLLTAHSFARCISNFHSKSFTIGSLTLNTGNIKPLADFYIYKLGFKKITSSETQLSFKAGKSVLTFNQSEASVKPFYHFAFNIPSNKIQSCMEYSQSRGLTLISNPGLGNNIFYLSNFNAFSIFFFDPAGNIVEFIARKNLNYTSEGQFGIEKDVLNISEIGIVVDDVEKTANLVCTKLSLSPYGSLNPQFVPVGSEEGMVIIVKNQRIWFPTGELRADIFPVNIMTANTLASIKVDEYPYYMIPDGKQ